jgi:hypothetical protein
MTLGAWITARTRTTHAVRQASEWLFPPDPLTQLANRYGSDKGSRAFGRHYYTRIYHRFFSEMRDRPITLLEIGLRHPSERRNRAIPSLRMWRDYFRNARLIGFDIDDFSDASLTNCQIVCGDMGSRADLSRLFQLGPFDIVIEDGSHASIHQQIALGTLFPRVASGGFYFIEDLNWQPASLERPDVPKTRDILRRGRLDFAPLTSDERAFLASHAQSIELFDTQDEYNRDRSDALGLIRRR